MMKRFGNMCAIVTLVTGVSVGAALAQVPPLGFTIDPTTGIRGTTVNGQVNPADVAANCVTDLTAFEAEFEAEAVFTGPYAGGGTGGDLFPRFFLAVTSSSRTPIRRPTVSRASSCSESRRTLTVPPRPRCHRRS